MSRVWCTEFISVDGVVEAADERMGELVSDESNALVEQDVADANRMLLGRRTFDELVSFWPDQPDDVPIAAVTNRAKKTVVSRSLQEASWGPDTQIRPDAVEAVRELIDAGASVSVWGSPTVAKVLLRAGLIDEIRLFVVPVVLGQGLRLFDEDWSNDLTLRESRELPNGVLRLVYAVSSTAALKREGDSG